MTLEEFAIKAGCVLKRCDKEWGGTWAYTTKEHPNSSTCGFRTKTEAINGFCRETFGEEPLKALKLILNNSPAS